MTTATGDPIGELLPRLAGVKGAGAGKWSARCPAHEDQHASLSIARGRDGRVLLHCHAGCTLADICRALGIDQRDLFADDGKHNGNGRAAPSRIVRVHRYVSPDGELLAEKLRNEPKRFAWRRPDGKGGYIYNRDGIGPMLYRVPELLNAREDRPDEWRFVCEGEHDADDLHAAGLIATCNSDGAGKWQPEFAETFRGQRVAILPHHDPVGERHAQDVARSLHGIAADVRVVHLPGLAEHGDAADWLAAGGTAVKLLELVEAAPVWTAESIDAKTEPDNGPPGMDAADLITAYPSLRPVIVEGCLRATETAGLIAPPKSHKTYTAIDLAIAAAVGHTWLGHPVAQTRVAYIDLELHPETFAHRLARVASARGVRHDDLRGRLIVRNLRGVPVDVFSIGPYLSELAADGVRLFILDAIYKLTPAGMDENSNSDVTRIYTQIDYYASETGGAIVGIHHASKGVQADKRIVDVGAGAGAQARAVDSHLILREHEEPDCMVLDGAVRSFAPLKPQPLRWVYPVYCLADDLDPEALRETGRRRRKPVTEADVAQPVEPEWTALRFASEFITADPQDQRLIIARAREAGLSGRRADDLLRLALAGGQVHRWAPHSRRDPIRIATVPQPLTDTRGAA